MVKQVSRLAVAVAAASLFSAGVQASGYKVNEQGAKHAGRAFAGSAAVADDASVVFFNPAGMSRLESSQASFGFTYIQSEGDFDGVRTNPTGMVTSEDAEADVYNDGGNFMPTKVIPFGYMVHKLDEKAAVGFGIFAPFGTETDYSSGSLAGGFADQTKLLTLDFQPSMSYKLSDTFTFGVGIDMVYAYGLLSKELDLIPYAPMNPVTGGLLADEDYQGYENKFEVQGNDTGYGWNFGFMWDATPATTLGFSYRSEIDFELEGKAEFKTNTGVSALADADGDGNVDGIYPVDGATGTVNKQDARVPLTTPRSATFSLAHQYDDKLRLTAGATWTDWSVFKYFDVIATDEGIIDDIAGLGENYIGHIVEKWNDTWSVAVGADYVLNPEWTLRAGYAYDQSPVDDKHRTARVPDNDRQWLTAGTTYNLNSAWSFDASLAYLFIDKSRIDEYNHSLDDEISGADNLNGTFDINAWAMSLQANYRM